MFIDIVSSHVSPGSEQASMAVLTVSWDKFGGRHTASSLINLRVEMATENVLRTILGPLVQQ